ncbi:nadph-dependent fmn fad containing oxidoreductase like protein [Zymoseptoria brevis]|uniref:NADPH-dependent diflavin oxidoreductase 1 n=1 Tax=Zymoseptoria brevis TaxID=1047168 RepID=A0A0F4GX56_9PEZI|nr:nadph-dependent fmn fad containing oxidoreductase like protein [Zymoseptoria brevis]
MKEVKQEEVGSIDRPRTALILYGSETGNAQDVAEEIGRLTERLHFETTILDLDSVQLRDVVKPTIVIFAMSTAGQGEMPQNARSFWKKLLSSALRPGILRKVRFSSFGLGDSSYAQFNVAHRMLHGRLVQLGAKPFCERGEGNEQHPEGHSAGFREWIVVFRNTLLEAFPLPQDIEPIPDDVFVEPKWRLEMIESSQNGSLALSMNGDADGNHTNGASIPSTATPQDIPDDCLLPIVDGFTASIASNERLTSPDHFQDVRLLDLRIPQQVSYGPGAVAVIYPRNFPSDVNTLIELMDWTTIADTPLRLTSATQPTTTTLSTPSPLRNFDLTSATQPTTTTLSTPSPLRNFDLTSQPLTIRYLLTNILDIMSIPRRTFFASLSYLLQPTDPDSDMAYQKTRLLELADPSLIDELWDYTTRPKRTILEVMMDFTQVKIPFQYILSIIPLMRGRQFSIASGGALKQDEQDRTRLQLLVAILDPPSPIIKYRRRYGVATRYISTLRAGQRISIGVQPGYLDVSPAELDVPAIMIGPGTGLAPMRSLIWERAMWRSQLSSTSLIPHDELTTKDLLFTGHRSPSSDFFFADEYPTFPTLTVHPSFSRSPEHPRQYVQDAILAHSREIYTALVRKGGRVFVCGRSGAMPKAVREAICQVLAKESEEGMSGEESEMWVARLEKEGRWRQETW